MKYPDAPAFRQALEQRLKTMAERDSARVARLRKRIGFDRLLARLEATGSDKWLLKGGYALDLRLGDRARTTKDIDIEWKASQSEVLGFLIAAAAHDANDFFTLQIERSGNVVDRVGGTQRFRVSVSLAGRLFEAFVVDIGFRHDPAVALARLTTVDLLGFANIPPVEVDAISLEFHIAEKVHAYTRLYARSSMSSRVKDLVDLALIAELSTVEASGLRGGVNQGWWDPLGRNWTNDEPIR